MRTKIYGIVGVLCIVFIILSISKNNKEQESTGEVFWGDCIIDDSLILEEEYDINELYDLFGGRNAAERVVFKSHGLPTLGFDEVDQKFPVEVVRTAGYSVYRVKQGGYFYVFWSSLVMNGSKVEKTEPTVFFSAYLRSDKSIKSFDGIIPGKSTAEDVKKIDPSTEFNFLRASGIFSNSYLNSDTILEIEYEDPENGINDYADLIVKSKRSRPREGEVVPSAYCAILEKDLPVSRIVLIIRGVCIGVGIVAASAFAVVMARRKGRRPDPNSSSKR